MLTDYIPPRLRAANGLGLVERDLLAEIRSHEGYCPEDADALSAALCRIQPKHVEAAITRLRNARLIEVVLDAHDNRLLRVTELGRCYWEPEQPREPKPDLVRNLRAGGASSETICVEADPGPVVAEATASCPAPERVADAVDFASNGTPCVTVQRTREGWQETLADEFKPRTRDGPASLRAPKGSLAQAVVAGRQGGYCVPEDLFAILPPEVVLALNRGEPCIPMGADKKPLVKWKEFQDRIPEARELRRWTIQFREQIAGWARVTGRISGVIVLDDDGGRWLERWGLKPHVLTGGGGWHWIGEYPGWRVKTMNSVSSRQLGEAYPMLDIRADGGYSIIAGYSEKGGYTWLREATPEPLDLLPQHARRFFGLEHAPRPGVKLAVHEPGPVPKAGERVPVDIIVCRAVRIAGYRGRNNGAYWLAQQANDNGYSQAECEGLYSLFASQVGGTNTRGECDPFTEEEWRATIRSAYSQPARTPWTREER